MHETQFPILSYPILQTKGMLTVYSTQLNTNASPLPMLMLCFYTMPLTHTTNNAHNLLPSPILP